MSAAVCRCKHRAYWHGPDGCEFRAWRSPYDPRPRGNECSCSKLQIEAPDPRETKD